MYTYILISHVIGAAFVFRYLATGCTFVDLHYSYRLGKSTIAKFVKQVCQSIWTSLVDEFLPNHTTESCEAVAEGFEKRRNFPHCIGAVDGKHIRIIKPELSGSVCFNYKSYFSLVLMAVADSNYKFIYVDIGSYGSEADPNIFNLRSLWKSIEENRLVLPSPRPFNSTLTPDIPYFLIGDEAFGLSVHLQRPYGGKQLTVTKRVFNYRICRSRRYIECTFGILNNKFRIFHRPLNVNPNCCIDIVKACVVLHNVIWERDGFNYEDTREVVRFEDIEFVPTQNPTRVGGKKANQIRNVLADYFFSDAGSVPWQMSRI